MASIIGNEAWYALKGKVIQNSTIIIKDMGDLHPFPGGPQFPNVNTLIVDHCDKNFVYYWIYPTKFPEIKKLYLHSHPCEPHRLYDWSRQPVDIYLATRYLGYKKRWAPEASNITLSDELPAIKEEPIELK